MLYWRKWLYDLDNRAAQETGYLFEPILASAIGGTSVSAKRSPVKRQSDRRKGRQVDCVKQKLAYEFKLRVTIAASGQGRGKLSDLVKAFHDVGGQTFVGDSAWRHLESEAGPVMSIFLERYVRQPLLALLNDTPDPLPPMTVRMTGDGSVEFEVGSETLRVERSLDLVETDPEDMPDDVSD